MAPEKKTCLHQAGGLNGLGPAVRPGDRWLHANLASWEDHPELVEVEPETLPFSAVRKRPVTVHAVVATHRTHIPTPEGILTAEVGDYIVRGVSGEYYPVKPDIFARTYEFTGEGAPFSSEGASRIFAERHRQISEERFDAEHDAQHNGDGELVEAAIAYAAAPNSVFAYRKDLDNGEGDCFIFERIWPWDESHDKRTKHGKIRRLEIAGALIAAEIDRLLKELKRVSELKPGDTA